MLGLISAGGNTTYNGFQTAGVRRESIPGGLRALEALGLIGAKRATFKVERQRYDRNQYWVIGQWRNFEPASLSEEARQAARARAKAIAIAARIGIVVIAETKGTPGTSNADLGFPEVPLSASQHEDKTKTDTSVIRFPAVPVRGTDSGATSYEKKESLELSRAFIPLGPNGPNSRCIGATRNL